MQNVSVSRKQRESLALQDRNNVAWTVLIAGFLQYGCFTESIELFNQMRAELMTLDQFALATLISSKWLLQQDGFEPWEATAFTLYEK
jgi:pentatricopeptide repeat protein